MAKDCTSVRSIIMGRLIEMLYCIKHNDTTGWIITIHYNW